MTWFAWIVIVILCVGGLGAFFKYDDGLGWLLLCIAVGSALCVFIVSVVNKRTVETMPTPAQAADMVSSAQIAQILTGGESRSWDSLAETKSWFNRDCDQSVATYTLNEDGTVTVHNECFADFEKTREVKGTATTTKIPGVLAVSFFPGTAGQFVVREQNGRFVIVTNGDNTSGWLLHAQDDSTTTLTEIKQWRDKLRAMVQGVVDINW